MVKSEKLSYEESVRIVKRALLLDHETLVVMDIDPCGHIRNHPNEHPRLAEAWSVITEQIDSWKSANEKLAKFVSGVASERNDFLQAIHELRPYADAYNHVCIMLGIRNNVVECVQELKSRLQTLEAGLSWIATVNENLDMRKLPEETVRGMVHELRGKAKALLEERAANRKRRMDSLVRLNDAIEEFIGCWATNFGDSSTKCMKMMWPRQRSVRFYVARCIDASNWDKPNSRIYRHLKPMTQHSKIQPSQERGLVRYRLTSLKLSNLIDADGIIQRQQTELWLAILESWKKQGSPKGIFEFQVRFTPDEGERT